MNKRYLWLIELLCCWEGKCNASRLAKECELSLVQAKKYFRTYQQDYPHQIEYCASQKTFVPAQTFRHILTNPNVNDYLAWLGNRVEVQQDANLVLTRLHAPVRYTTPVIMRAISRAIKERKRLDVEYVSVRNPVNDGRVIQPHTIVQTGTRYHVRAFDEQTDSFRDFVLSRFRGIPELLDNATKHASDDDAWQTQVELIFEPDPRFSPAQKVNIETDFNMINGQLRIQARAPLAQYLIDEMQINIKFYAKTPEEQQLVLANLDTVKPWLFGL